MAEKTFPFFFGVWKCLNVCWDPVEVSLQVRLCPWPAPGLMGVHGLLFALLFLPRVHFGLFSLQQGQFDALGLCLELGSLEAALEMFWQCRSLQQQPRARKDSRQGMILSLKSS